MIAGCFHEGSGLGNQLFRYITTRTIAEDKGFEWGMVNPQNFKGGFFPNIDLGKKVDLLNPIDFDEKRVIENGIDVRSYDPEVNFIQDYTILDGEFQDSRYWGHKLPEIDKWLKVEPIQWQPMYLKDKLCVIGFRGGEYYSDPNLGLPKEYFDDAISRMKQIHADMRFEVHTDDEALAKQFFPDIPVVPNNRISHSKHSNMSYNWRAMRYAKYAIIANSSFYILPRLLKHQYDTKAITIAPRYWARHTSKVWALPQNYYKPFTYI